MLLDLFSRVLSERVLGEFVEDKKRSERHKKKKKKKMYQVMV